MHLKWIKGSEDFSDAYDVRKNVFVLEQSIDESLELDEYDAISLHLVVYNNRTPVATGRVFGYSDSFVIGRICVLKEYRSMHLGTLLMEKLIEKAISMRAKEVHLSSQLYATGFYSKFGFEEYGNTYLDAGIEHISMVRKVN
ncbi:GNAT family N-acetyltransferase [Methanolobus mangrovi]|uniref:GNAT family N-acetyltransferase n=1 Tax=Methanolobus mangrovi TaxID=3072977 RepID=A0AA51YJH7_9EURY|nr:GNAT family N-acetyltransferase [Methanolobus mangrovi]WMW22608.1 GNAT family N-acetyltransferase [Methanolobus mangrovi]